MKKEVFRQPAGGLGPAAAFASSPGLSYVASSCRMERLLVCSTGLRLEAAIMVSSSSPRSKKRGNWGGFTQTPRA